MRNQNRYDSPKYSRADRQHVSQSLEESGIQVSLRSHFTGHILMNGRRIPVFVENAQQAVDCARFLGQPLEGSSSGRYVTPYHRSEASKLMSRLCPIFMVSNVTGEKLPLLRQFLNVLPSSQMDDKYVVDAPFEFQISDVFSVPFVGTVVVCPPSSSCLAPLMLRAG